MSVRQVIREKVAGHAQEHDDDPVNPRHVAILGHLDREENGQKRRHDERCAIEPGPKLHVQEVRGFLRHHEGVRIAGRHTAQ